MTLLLTLDDGSVQRKLADAVGFARAAVLEEAPEEQIGAHVGVGREDAVSASHLFEAQVPGYRGWRWSVTVALAGDDEPVTVSEVVLVPGPEALIAPAWVPWERRVRAGDLGVGDIFPTDANDPRLAPAYLQSDDPAVEEVARETGLGRIHVLSRYGREDAATRWHSGEFGPRSDMARSAPGVCGTCGFFVPLAGSLRGGFGVCTNDIAPADGHVVDVEYGCGAHSEVEVEVTSSIPVAELVYDDSLLDFDPAPAEAEPAPAAPAPVASDVSGTVAPPTVAEVEAVALVEATEAVESPAAEPETALAEADLSPAEVEPELAVEPQTEEAKVAEPSATAEAAEAIAEPVAPAEADSVVAEPVVAEAEPTQVVPVTAETESDAADSVAAEGDSTVAERVVEAESVEVDPVTAETDSVAAEGDSTVAEPTVAEAAPEVSEPSQAEAAAGSQSVVPEAGALVAEAPETIQPAVTDAEPQGNFGTEQGAEDAAVVEQAEGVSPESRTAAAEPQAATEPVSPEVAVAEPVAADLPEAVSEGSKPAEREVADVVVEPQVVDEQPAGPVATGGSEPAQGEEAEPPVVAAGGAAAGEQPQADVPAVAPAAGTGEAAARVDVAELPASTPEARETTVGEADAAVTGDEVEVPEAAPTDSVVTKAEPNQSAGADPAQATETDHRSER